MIQGHDPTDEIVLTVFRRGDDTEVLEVEVTLGRNRDDEGEIVTYLGIWYRPLGAAVPALAPRESPWDRSAFRMPVALWIASWDPG